MEVVAIFLAVLMNSLGKGRGELCKGLAGGRLGLYQHGFQASVAEGVLSHDLSHRLRATWIACLVEADEFLFELSLPPLHLFQGGE
jgi:hypothetical protein